MTPFQPLLLLVPLSLFLLCNSFHINSSNSLASSFTSITYAYAFTPTIHHNHRNKWAPLHAQRRSRRAPFPSYTATVHDDDDKNNSPSPTTTTKVKAMKVTKRPKQPKSTTTKTTTNSTNSIPITTIGGGENTIFQMARRMLLWDDSAETNQPRTITLPRWHPYSGVSDVNPNFRQLAPPMTVDGYAASIWRNARKRNKPSLWRHALRTYYGMQGTVATATATTNTNHHQGALVACAKLGLWQEAMAIYNNATTTTTTITAISKQRMVSSVLRACVCATPKTREPLDAAKTLLSTTTTTHDRNALLSAYQRLGIHNYDKDDITLKRHQDKASHALQVQGAIANKDWAKAVEALTIMTEHAGYHPTTRHLNSWQQYDARTNKKQTWKQKRDYHWLDSV